jgi:SAM-dependent methyltransferase
MEVMEHVDDPRQLMHELARVTAPGGAVLISVPDPASEAIQKHLAPESYWTKPNHVRILERDQFNQIVADSGLTIVSQTYRKFFSTMYWSLFWAADQHLGAPEKPVLRYWRKTWESLLESPHGYPVKATLDRMMPKSQVIIATKPDC